MDALTAALDLSGLSYRDDQDGWFCISNMTKDQDDALRAYLFQTYDLTEIGYYFPYMVLRCHGQLPDESTRPFTIAGALVIWLSADDPVFWSPFGEHAWGEIISIPEEVSEQAEQSEPLPQEVLDYFAFTLFPDCVAIAVIDQYLVVQLRKADTEKYIDRLQTLPRGFRSVPLRPMYFNGFLPHSERRPQQRVITPSTSDRMGLDVAPKLLRSSECKINEEYVVGNQPLRGMGHQYLKKTRDGSRLFSRDEPADSDALPREGQQYMELTQGIYHARPELMKAEPHVRDSLCGRAILRVEAFDADRKLVDVAHEGGISGVMQHWEMQSPDPDCMAQSVYYLLYVEVLDHLIEDGWTAVAE